MTRDLMDSNSKTIMLEAEAAERATSAERAQSDDWEVVVGDALTEAEMEDARVRRLRVPGGWLYQVSAVDYRETPIPKDPQGRVEQHATEGWWWPVFVADPTRRSR